MPSDEQGQDEDVGAAIAFPRPRRQGRDRTVAPNSDPTRTATGRVAPDTEARLTFAPDDVAAGRYRIVRLIARGGMGEVYEAVDLELAVRVALKTIRGGAARAELVEQFKREVQLARRIVDRHVCRVFDLGREGETVFLTMEHLDGQTLSERLDREGPLGAQEARRLALELAGALAAAHRAGVFHRDLKSANIVLTPDGAVVTDFGLARELGRGPTGEDARSGTPAYMAPEQSAGGSVGAACDVYALGVVLHEALTGELPEPGRPRRLGRRWRKLVSSCLEPDPARRPLASDVAARLARGSRWPVVAAVAVAIAAVLALWLR